MRELPRMPIPRTTVNKGKEKGRSYDAPTQLSLYGYLGTIRSGPEP